MDLVVKFFSPIWLLRAAADLSFWQRHQRDQRMRTVSRLLWHYVLRWSIITALLLTPAAGLARGVLALALSIAGSVSASVTLLIVSVAISCLVGSWQ